MHSWLCAIKKKKSFSASSLVLSDSRLTYKLVVKKQCFQSESLYTMSPRSFSLERVAAGLVHVWPTSGGPSAAG